MDTVLQTASAAAAVIFCLIGLGHAVRILIFSLFRIPEGRISVTVRIENADEAENIIVGVIERMKWDNIAADVRFICDDPEAREIAEKIICGYPEISLLSEVDLNYNK